MFREWAVTDLRCNQLTQGEKPKGRILWIFSNFNGTGARTPTSWMSGYVSLTRLTRWACLARNYGFRTRPRTYCLLFILHLSPHRQTNSRLHPGPKACDSLARYDLSTFSCNSYFDSCPLPYFKWKLYSKCLNWFSMLGISLLQIFFHLWERAQL